MSIYDNFEAKTNYFFTKKEKEDNKISEILSGNVDKHADNPDYLFYIGLYYYYTLFHVEKAICYFKKGYKHNPKCCYILGNHWSEKGDIDKGIEWYLKGIELGDVMSMISYATICKKKGKIYEHLKYLRLAIDKKSSYAMCLMGDYYRNIEMSKYVKYRDPKSFILSIKYFEMAIRNVDMDYGLDYKVYLNAHFNLGNIHSISENYRKATTHYKIVSDTGDKNAKYLLALNLYYSKTDKDRNEGIKLLKELVEVGDEMAAQDLIKHYSKEEKNDKQRVKYMRKLDDIIMDKNRKRSKN